MIEQANMSVVQEKNVTNGKENKGIAKTSQKYKTIKLIKVPKFVSNQWMKSSNGEIVGLFDFENNEISNVYVRKEDTEDTRKLICKQNATINTYLLKKNRINLKTKLNNGSKSIEIDAKKKGMEYYKKKGKESSNSLMKGNNNNVILTSGNSNKKNEEEDGTKEQNVSILCADVIKSCDTIYSFLPVLDQDYSKILKERHYYTNVKKERSTIIETRNEESIDAENTLFKFYTAEDRFNMRNNMDKGRRGIQLNNYEDYNLKGMSKNMNIKDVVVPNKNNMATMKSLHKNNTVTNSMNKHKHKHAKKPNAIDIDKAKINIFRIFEREGRNGVPFSVFSKSFNMPPNQLKNILDEVAVKRKRNIDKKSVYFLKDFV